MPGDIDRDLLKNLRLAALDRSYASLGGRRTGSVHEFYRYPARFSPLLARAAIKAFTSPRELVIDPLTGGGTSVVEAQLLGRHSIAADISPLATFITTAKTTLYSSESLDQLQHFADAAHYLSLTAGESLQSSWAEQGYWRNISNQRTWRIRNLLLNGIKALKTLHSTDARTLGRCALLRTGQWALDMRATVPTVEQFRQQLSCDIETMVSAANSHYHMVMEEWSSHTEPTVIGEGLPESAMNPLMLSNGPPNLILTSPPYPGVYVLYHRWKVHSRRETPAPFWIANCLDGHGISHYTMSARNGDSSDLYFKKLRKAFSGLVELMSRDTWLVQVVGFSGGTRQFQRYLRVMHGLGLIETRFPDLATSPDGRLWREVPGRRWWVAARRRRGIAPHTSREVVLIHRKM